MLIRNAHEGIRFIVAQEDVEFRLVPFDELIFEQQRIELGVNDGEFYLPDLADQPQGFAVVPFEWVK